MSADRPVVRRGKYDAGNGRDGGELRPAAGAARLPADGGLWGRVPHALAGDEIHGVQISWRRAVDLGNRNVDALAVRRDAPLNAAEPAATRSEERRVGKECRSRW